MPKYPQDPSIARLFQRGQPVTFGKGEVILGNTPAPNGVYFISTGYVKIYAINDNGEQSIHIIYGPGELFPILWGYLGIEPESLFYEALSDTVTWHISRDWFLTFLRNDPDLSFAMSLQLARQFLVYSDRVDNLEYKKASDRIVYRLLFLASRFGERNSHGHVTIEAPLTHEVLANTVNLARESVSRELERLEQKQLISQKNHSIQLLDIPALAAMLSRPVNLSNWNLL